MLAARRIPQILQDSLSDGIDGMCLMTKEGSLLSSAFTAQATIDEIGLAAISSSIWGNYSEGMSTVTWYFRPVLSHVLVAACF